jgi:hypothetical protein
MMSKKRLDDVFPVGPQMAARRVVNRLKESVAAARSFALEMP